MPATEETNLDPTHSNDASAKWAAIIDDRPVPMPRRRLRARDILHQAVVSPGRTLVRDYNSPSDVGFDDDAVIDLAGGNVFTTAEGCARSLDPAARSAPKLAFFMNDKWELTIQGNQTGETLRGLFNLSKRTELLRDYESPHDEIISDDESIVFKDGPVFLTRSRDPNVVTIIVEGTPHEWRKPKLTHTEVATLFDPTFPQHPDTTYSITYEKGPGGAEGTLSKGDSVKVKNEMEFHVSPTGQS